MHIVIFLNSAPFATSVIVPTFGTTAGLTLQKHSAQSKRLDWKSSYFNFAIAT